MTQPATKIRDHSTIAEKRDAMVLSLRPSKEALEQAWSRIALTKWDQMNWFVKLAKVNLESLSQGDLLNLQEEFVAILSEQASVTTFPPDAGDPIQYPLSAELSRLEKEGKIDLGTWSLPTWSELQEAQQAVKRHVDRLADDLDTQVGPLTVNFGISVNRNSPEQLRAGSPRFSTYRLETTRSNRPQLHQILLRLGYLLESFASRIFRCPHCQQVFLQLRRNARYCGRKCHSVAGTQRARAEAKARAMQKGRREQTRRKVSRKRRPVGTTRRK